jgi:integrative and conjugative element protein (TIGR02256 family)
MSDREFWSKDHRYGLKINSEAISSIFESCRLSAPEETGGILVGFYTDDLSCAVVTDASARPPDSRGGRTWFARGTVGLQRWLDGLWRQSSRRYYLGEWHFHPGGRPRPSSTDIKQMTDIAYSASYKCPEPALVIVGGTASDLNDMKAFVFSSSGASIRMQPLVPRQ